MVWVRKLIFLLILSARDFKGEGKFHVLDRQCALTLTRNIEVIKEGIESDISDYRVLHDHVHKSTPGKLEQSIVVIIKGCSVILHVTEHTIKKAMLTMVIPRYRQNCLQHQGMLTAINQDVVALSHLTISIYPLFSASYVNCQKYVIFSPKSCYTDTVIYIIQ